MTDPSTYRFCPRCGAPLECRTLKAAEPPRLVCRACAFVFFLDPKVATGVVLLVAILITFAVPYFRNHSRARL